MALDHGYAVLIGTLTGYHRDTPDDQGRWYHVHLEVDAGETAFEVAVDVDSKQSSTGARWKVVTVTAGELARPPRWGPVSTGCSRPRCPAPLTTSVTR